ncbi:poly-gamma-glutamate hydrolase family protein [Lihuaxuella thermophila]|nr:poly-gamma-glutamate hydrolase family protein [Lihuaxuella thermophila]
MKKAVFVLGSLLAFTFSNIPSVSAAEDVYANYEELAAHHQLGEDYDITTQSRSNDVIILGIHGGRIETGTSEIVKAVAQDDHSYYLFEANIFVDSNQDGRNDLHVTSTHFDEPTAIKMTAQKNKVVSIHGAAGSSEKIVYMGGLNTHMKNIISDKLSQAGFRVEPAPPELAGTSPNNICNKGRTLKGVQLEITRGLRDVLRADTEEGRAQLAKFAGAIRAGISASLSHPDGRTYDFGSSNFSYGFWLNDGKEFYLTGDDYLIGVQSPVNPKQTGKIRFEVYDRNNRLVLSKTDEAVGHTTFKHTLSGLATGYYKIKVVNVSGNASWIYGGLHY